MTYAYATVNLARGLAASAFTVAGGAADATRSYLNDGRLDRQYPGNASNVSNIAVDLGSSQEVRGFAVLNHNLGGFTSPSVSAVAANSSDFVTDYVVIKNSTTMVTTAPKNRDTVMQFAGGVSRRYWALNFAWTGTQTPRYGEVFLYGAPTVLTRGFTDGTGEAEEFITVAAAMRTGDMRTTFLAGPVRSIRLRAQDYTSSNNAELAAMWRASRGGAVPVLLIPSYDPSSAAATAAAQDVMLGRLGAEYSWAYSDFDLVQPPEMVLRSLGRAVGQ